MNRVFDERLELQLQEYEFAELDQLLPARPLIHATHPVVVENALRPLAVQGGLLAFATRLPSANE